MSQRPTSLVVLAGYHFALSLLAVLFGVGLLATGFAHAGGGWWHALSGLMIAVGAVSVVAGGIWGAIGVGLLKQKRFALLGAILFACCQLGLALTALLGSGGGEALLVCGAWAALQAGLLGYLSFSPSLRTAFA